MQEKNSILKTYRFPIILLLGIVIGSFIGTVAPDKAMMLKPFGDIFLNMLFALVVPLVLVSISNSIAQMQDMKRLGKIISSMFGVFLITGLIASIIMVITVMVFPPAKGLNITLSAPDTIEPLKTSAQIVKMFTVDDFPQLISRRNILPLIIFALFFGFSVKVVGDKAKPVVAILGSLNAVFMKMISILMHYAPIGLGAYFSVLVAEYGPEFIGSYARSMVIYYIVTILYFLLFFPIYAYLAGGVNGLKSLKHLIAPAITSLGTMSSIGTLPVSLNAAEKIGVSKDIRNIVLPIGATTHMDGSCLSGILKIAMLFGIFGIPFEGTSTIVTAVIMAILSGFVMSGVPGGGLIGEMLIMSLYGFPMEAFPILATVGYLVDPPATMVNAVGDSVASMLVSRIVEGKDWMKKNLLKQSVE